MKENNKKKTLKTIIRFSVLALCGVILGVNIYSANASKLVGNKLPMPFGVGAAVVLSGSMEPELSAGDLIIVKETETVAKDQVVVFQDGNSLVVHRIIEIDETDGTIVTKGDANNVADEPIHPSRVKGEVAFAVPYVGSVVEFIKTPLGTIAIALLAILLLEIPRLREKKMDTEETEKLKEEIRKLKSEIENQEQN